MNPPVHHKALKFRIYPTSGQKVILDRNFGAVRFVWNKLVENFNAWGSESYIDKMSEKNIKEGNEWLADVISAAVQQKRIDFSGTVSQFFNKNRKKKLGGPKFKKRGVSTDSFRIPAQSLGYNKCIIGNKVKCPKIGKIKISIDRAIPDNAKYLSLTFSKTKTSEYYVSVLVEVQQTILPKTYKDIGIDLGLTHIATLSDGTKIINPRNYRKNQATLAKIQRHLSRKKKGSNSYEKQRLKLANFQQKTARKRHDEYHKLSKWLVEQYDSICMEDLNVSGMTKNRRLAKSIADASFSTLVGMIAYKCKWYGKELIQVNRFFPSSKTCSCCGFKNKTMPLNVRDWSCPECHVLHDRDVNAAKNILNNALLTQHGIVSEGHPENIDGEVVRLTGISISGLTSKKSIESVKSS